MIDENVRWNWNISIIIDQEGISCCRGNLYYIVIYYGVLCDTSVLMGYVQFYVTINLY